MIRHNYFITLLTALLISLSFPSSSEAGKSTFISYYPILEGTYENLQISGNLGIGTFAPKNKIEFLNIMKFNNSAETTSIGRLAGQGHTNTGNTSFGNEALNLTENNGSENTAIGARTLSSNTTGDRNTAIGFLTGPISTDRSNTTAIGYQAAATQNNQIILGHTYVTKLLCAVVTITAISDERFKSRVSENIPGLAFITQLRPVSFHWDMDKLHTFIGMPDDQRDKEAEQGKAMIEESGFIAQEVERAALAVGYKSSGVKAPKNDKDTYKMGYTTLVVPLIKAAQELNSAVIRQDNEIADLKAERNTLALKVQEVRPTVERLKAKIREITAQLDHLNKP